MAAKPVGGGWPLFQPRILNEAQFRLNATLGHGSFSTYQLAFGPNSMDLDMWHDDDSDLEFT